MVRTFTREEPMARIIRGVVGHHLGIYEEEGRKQSCAIDYAVDISHDYLPAGHHVVLLYAKTATDVLIKLMAWKHDQQMHAKTFCSLARIQSDTNRVYTDFWKFARTLHMSDSSFLKLVTYYAHF